MAVKRNEGYDFKGRGAAAEALLGACVACGRECGHTDADDVYRHRCGGFEPVIVCFYHCAYAYGHYCRRGERAASVCDDSGFRPNK